MAGDSALTTVTADECLVAFLTALEELHPTRLVKQRALHTAPGFEVLALGKAANAMAWGLVEAGHQVRGIGVAPTPGSSGLGWHTGSHPVPDERSLAAGQAVLEWAASRPPGTRILALLSGGTSAMMEASELPLDELQAKWREWNRRGLPIEELNRRRSQHSMVKGGKLADALLARGCEVECWVIQDTTELRAVGSGPVWHPDVPHHVLADNQDLVKAVANRIPGAVAVDRRVVGPVTEEVQRLVEQDTGDIAVLGGEPTLTLPNGVSGGGRCQHAALAAGLQGVPLWAAGSDGRDGTTRAAGGWSTGRETDNVAATALANFDAHGYLEARRQTIVTGPTGNNLNDVWISMG